MTLDDPSSPPAYAALLKTRNLAADTVLVEALEELESGYQPVALEVLLARGQEAALARVVAGFDRFGEDLRELLVQQADRLAAGVRLCIADEQFETRRAAVELIRRSGSCKLAYLLAETLRQPCRKTSELAAQALLALACKEHDGRRYPATAKNPLPRSEIDYLATALKRGLASWPLHFRTEVVRAAVRLCEYLEHTILELADNTRAKVAFAFNSLVCGGREPQLAGYCLRVFRSQPLHEAAARLFGSCREEHFRRVLLDEAWLLADEDIRQPLARVRSVACLEDETGTIIEMGAPPVRAAVRLICACGLRHQRKIHLLRQFLLSANPAAERAATWALVDHHFEGSAEELSAVSARARLPLSLIARIELLRRRGEPFTTPSTGSSPEAMISASYGAEGASGPSAFEPYWKEFDALALEDRVAIGKTVAARAPRFEEQLRGKWAQAAPAERVRVLKIIRELGLIDRFEKEVYEAARDPDNVTRSAAVTLLGSLDSVTSRRILRAALDDSDERVQANALEAFECLGAEEHAEHAFRMLDSDHHRVRANAVKMLLQMRVREGAARLIDMLSSEASAHRISALWVVQRLRLASVMQRLTLMADTDPDPRVRRRARRVLGGFESSPAPPTKPITETLT